MFDEQQTGNLGSAAGARNETSVPPIDDSDIDRLFEAIVPVRELYEPETLRKLAERLPYQVAIDNQAVLLEANNGIFLVGMVAPGNYTHLRNVARALKTTSSKVSPRLLTEARYNILLDGAYQHDMQTVHDPEEPTPAEEIEDPLAEQHAMNWQEFAQSDSAQNSTEVADSDLEIGKGSGLRADAERIILDAIRYRASDMHLVPWHDYGYITYRTDGRKWKRFPKIPTETMDKLANALADMAGINAYQLSHQDIESKIPIVVSSKSGRKERMTLRFQGGPVLYGRNIVIRIQRAIFRNFEQIGIEPSQIQEIQNALYKPHGVVLVTGATGSGKSNTLEAMLRRVEEINDYEVNLIQAGNPIEFPNPERIQKELKGDGSWERALEAALRLDPDIFSPGEFRNASEAKIVFDGATTGHLTLTTLHTNDVASTFSRLDSLQIDRDRQAALIELIVSQRLVKVLCEHCKLEDPRSREIADQLIQVVFPNRADLKEAVNNAQGGSPFYHKSGCKACNYSGIKGRTCIAEVLTITPEIRRMLRAGASGEEITKYAIKHYGMMTLAEAAARKLCAGIIPYDAVRGLLMSPETEVPETETHTWQTAGHTEPIYAQPSAVPPNQTADPQPEDYIDAEEVEFEEITAAAA